ncbi:hypothetical protein MJD09_22550, partial [bacterium]|nr:hypothetical protein [bacterium]
GRINLWITYESYLLIDDPIPGDQPRPQQVVISEELNDLVKNWDAFLKIYKSILPIDKMIQFGSPTQEWLNVRKAQLEATIDDLVHEELSDTIVTTVRLFKDIALARLNYHRFRIDKEDSNREQYLRDSQSYLEKISEFEGDPPTILRLGVVYAQQEDYDKAISMFEGITDSDLDEVSKANMLDWLGYCYTQRSKKPKEEEDNLVSAFEYYCQASRLVRQRIQSQGMSEDETDYLDRKTGNLKANLRNVYQFLENKKYDAAISRLDSACVTDFMAVN